MPSAARPSAAGDPLVLRGISITHPQRVVNAELGLTKRELGRYYDTVAEVMLPHLRDRPLTLVQCAPDFAHCRFLRHSGQRAPANVRVIQIREQRKIGDYMVVDDATALLALAQRNIVEFHTWNAPASHVERPDRIVIDLDPGHDVTWPTVVRAARLVRSTLDELGLRSWLKTTGGDGLHIVVPIAPKHDWATCLEFARTVASSLEAHDPSTYTTRFAKRGRERLILVDYLRNNRTNTSVAAWSARSRAGATISMPLSWDELTPRFRPERWTVRSVNRRTIEARAPLWAEYFRTKQALHFRARGHAGSSSSSNGSTSRGTRSTVTRRSATRR
jgi:bifunctional non-homologous end joining protein LigD